MGTLTGDTPLLPEHCPHKLPTSCRLTATSLCCACQDKRPHAPSYPTYVDGVGFVQRGTRWQKYCWFCKEFWNNRVAATTPSLMPSQTRIPDIPDQTHFLERWYEFWSGYRDARSEGDGIITREEVVCERPWRDVAPGHLPVMDDAESVTAVRTEPSAPDSVVHVSLGDTLDELIEAANAEEQDPATTRRSFIAEHRRRHRSAAARVLQRVEDLNEANAHLTAAQQRRRQAVQELEAPRIEFEAYRAQHAQALQDHRTAQNQTRVFGTMEEIARQGADYVSPITNLFTRAYERYSVAEEVRAQERASVRNSARDLDFFPVRSQSSSSSSIEVISANEETEEETDEQSPDTHPQTLEHTDERRPSPQTDEQLTVRLVCRICLQQKADTAVVPCGHLIMCSYCADIWMPARAEDRTQPLRKTECPLCRKQVKKRFKVFTV